MWHWALVIFGSPSHIPPTLFHGSKSMCTQFDDNLILYFSAPPYPILTFAYFPFPISYSFASTLPKSLTIPMIILPDFGQNFQHSATGFVLFFYFDFKHQLGICLQSLVFYFHFYFRLFCFPINEK